MAFFAMLTTSI